MSDKDQNSPNKPSLLLKKATWRKQTLYRELTKTKAIISIIKDIKRYGSKKENKNRILFVNFKKE